MYVLFVSEEMFQQRLHSRNTEGMGGGDRNMIGVKRVQKPITM